ncbi:MAG: UDP binding domain-containing protein [Methanobacteriaceae archaeon]|nr:UDP binding domain-containing protein [Methanobacteriaceae archaeon]
MKIVIFGTENIQEIKDIPDITIYSDNSIDNMNVTNDELILSEVDVIIIKISAIINGEYNTDNIKEACTKISNYINDNTLIIFDTIVPPRTCKKMEKVLDEYELISDINIAYVTRPIPNQLLIAATNETSLEKTIEIYKYTSKNINSTKDISTAEIIPFLQETYTDTQIALVNQLAIISEALAVDLVEAIKYANLKKEINLQSPSPITKNNTVINTDKIVQLAIEYGETAQLSDTTRTINNYVPYHVAYIAEKELFLKHKLSFYECKIAVLGITNDKKLETQNYNSSLTLIDDLIQRKAEVWVHDDKVSEEIIEQHDAKKISLDEAYECDCIIVMVDDPQYKDLDPTKIEKILITAKPFLDPEKYKDIEFYTVGQYKLGED